jgi:hypothetical protein
MRPEDLVPVVSSNIAAVGYDAVQNILSIQFKGKEKVYEYHGVSLEIYEAMMIAESIGSFYARNIKNVFKGEPMEGNVNV